MVATRTRRKKIGLVVFGQSNENGQAELVNSSAVSQMTANPQAFQSQRNPAITSYLPGVNQLTYLSADARWYPKGSPWCRVYDDLWDWGYELQIANCSVGSMSFFADAVGRPTNRSNSANFFWKRRAPVHASDPGCRGAMTVQNSNVFECTTGSERFVLLRNEGAPIYAEGSTTETLPDRLDYVYSPTASKKTTAASAPDFTAATTVGSTVTDGAVVWTNIGTTASLGFAQNTAFGLSSVGVGFDPFGLVRNAAKAGQQLRAQGCERIIVYLCNGQSDAGATSAANYQTSLEYLTRFFRGLGFEVMIGLSTYTRAAATSGFDALVTGRAAALATFASDTKVYAGANLYTLMGTTDGANGLSYNTTGTTAENNAHLDAAGAIVAGGHHANAMKAVLPQRT